MIQIKRYYILKSIKHGGYFTTSRKGKHHYWRLVANFDCTNLVEHYINNKPGDFKVVIGDEVGIKKRLAV